MAITLSLLLLKGVVKVSLPPVCGRVPHGLLSSSFWITGLMAPPGCDMAGDVGLRRHRALLRQSAVFSLAFIGEREERLVLDDGAVNQAAELMVGKRVLGLVSRY